MNPATAIDGAVSPEALSLFTDVLTARGRSQHTIDAYTRDVLQFAAFCQGRGVADVLDAGKDDVVSFMAATMDAAQRSTLARKVHALRTFYRTCQRFGLASGNPAAAVHIPKNGTRLPPDILTPADVGKMIAACQGWPNARRDRALIETFYSTGCRLAEVLGATVEDWRQGEGFILVKGKGSKARIAPMGRKATAALKEYVEASYSLRRKLYPKPSRSPLFLNRTGGALCRRQVEYVIKKVVRLAGVSAAVNVHTFRHCAATHMLQSGADLRTLQTMLGHESLTTTAVYTHLNAADLCRVYQQAHPRAKRGGSNGDD